MKIPVTRATFDQVMLPNYAPADWLPLALVDGRGVTNEFGALMLALFYGAVVTARLAGAALLTRFTRVTVLRTSLAIAAIGILTVVLVPGPVLVS